MRIEELKIPTVVFLMAAALVLCGGLRAYAFDPSGWWQSASGARIYVAAGRDEVSVTIQSVDGRSSAFHGRWVQPMESFEYFAPQRGWRRVVCGGPNPNVMHVLGQDNRNVDWVRLEGGPPSPPGQPPSAPGGGPPMPGPGQGPPQYAPRGNGYVSSQPPLVEG